MQVKFYQMQFYKSDAHDYWFNLILLFFRSEIRTPWVNLKSYIRKSVLGQIYLTLERSQLSLKMVIFQSEMEDLKTIYRAWKNVI